MTSKNLNEAKLRQKLVEDHGIQFLPDVEPDRWPPNHRKHFQSIQSLGTRRFDSWAIDHDDVSGRPEIWEVSTKTEVKKLVKKARECRDSQPNERTWRSEIEPEVFRSFSVDAACQRCGLRQWRPDIDPRSCSEEAFTQGFTVNRASCRCSRREIFSGESRSAPIFAMREDTRVYHDPDVQIRLSRKWEMPDKVIALRASGYLKETLKAVSGKNGTDGRSLEDCLDPTLFLNETHPAVFPFLLGESKSEASCGSFSRINLQMALVIEKTLDIQDRLRKMAESECRWVAGPLVWCLSHHGPTWRLSAGYIRDRRPMKPHVKIEITTLWQGLITDHNGALQLLLIMDYISDWARYIHREAIIRQLQALALPNIDQLSDMLSSTGLSVDTYHGRRTRDNAIPKSPVYSHGGLLNLAMLTAPQKQDNLHRVSLWNAGQTRANLESCPSVPDDPFRQYDTHHAVARGTNFVTSRFVGLYMTTTNFDELADCIIKKQGSFRLLSGMLTRLEQEEAIYLDRSTLGDIEMMWTGQRQKSQEDESPQDEFHVLFTISHYVGSEWNLTREISFLAISEEAKDLLYEKVRGRQKKPWKRKGNMIAHDFGPEHFHSAKTIHQAINTFHKASTEAILVACLDRVSLRLRIDSLRHGGKPAEDVGNWLTFESGSEQCYMIPAPPALLRRVIWFLQKRSKEVRSPLIRVSRRQDDQSFILQGAKSSTVMTCHSENDVSYNEPLLTVADPADYRSESQVVARWCRFCIYVTDDKQLARLTEDWLTEGRRFQHCMETERVSMKSDDVTQWNTWHVDLSGRGTSSHLKSFIRGIDKSLRQQREKELFSSKSRRKRKPNDRNGSESEEETEREGESGEEDDEDSEDEDYTDDPTDDEERYGSDETYVPDEDGDEDEDDDSDEESELEDDDGLESEGQSFVTI